MDVSVALTRISAAESFHFLVFRNLAKISEFIATRRGAFGAEKNVGTVGLHNVLSTTISFFLYITYL